MRSAVTRLTQVFPSAPATLESAKVPPKEVASNQVNYVRVLRIPFQIPPTACSTSAVMPRSKPKQSAAHRAVRCTTTPPDLANCNRPATTASRSTAPWQAISTAGHPIDPFQNSHSTAPSP
uniref:(northern house mosquito) hypothetical protein n=1 Tax=Culex pipiens TaxID=7175 RepID=A0A8D8I1Z1_CULPI